ncbi:MAG: nuclear transport factor 2 family protein [Candidatus Acidiferrales bacterium]
MKLVKFLFLALAFLSAGSTRAIQLHPVSGDQRQADRDAIRNHIDKIFQAYIQKDGDVIRSTHSAEWLGFQANSQTAIHGIDQYMKGANGFIKSPVRMTSYKMLEFNVLFYGDVAIVPYVADVNYEFQGKTSTEKLRIFDIYVKLNGDWIQVASDTQRHPDSLAADMQQDESLSPDDKKELLDAREAVWRDFFANNTSHLMESLPPELIAIEQGDKWSTRDDEIAASKSFVEKGGKVVRLEFPQTEFQMYGYTAILYSKYLCETEMDGKRTTLSGRATEMFVYRHGKWVNVGWHLDSGS